MDYPAITLTTDFGLRDPYVAEMKAAILGISPNVRIVDISHEIEKFNIRMGAYILASASQYFPEGTVHVAVVDPSVGTGRRSLLIRTRTAYYVGPDNGLLILAANNQGIEHVYEISNRKLTLPRISNTFHGRDIFAPIAAHIANGIQPKDVGPEARKITIPSFAKLVKSKDMIIGEVLHTDGFGNIITNFTKNEIESMGIEKTVNVELKDTKLELRLCKAYGEVEKRKPLAIIGSHDFLEISINHGNAAKTFKMKNGDRVTLHNA